MPANTQQPSGSLEKTPPVIRKLFRHDCSRCPSRCPGRCPSRWSRFAADEDEHIALEKQTAEMPIVHRHIHVNKSWITESFTINSHHMRKVLSKVLNTYQDLDMECENWTFRPPYMPLVHRWHELKEFHTTASDAAVLKAAQDLTDFVSLIVGPSADALEQTRSTGKVAFESLWQIFPPATLVMTKVYDQETVCRVLKYTKRDRTLTCPAAWIVEMEYVSWNGERCGYQTTRTGITEYEGYRRALSLPTWPISFHSNANAIKAEMVTRGRKFEELRSYHFMQYEGRKIVTNMDGEKEERPASGRVIIDAFAYYTSSNEIKHNLRPLNPNKETNGSVAEKINDSDSDSCSLDEDDDISDVSSIRDGPELTVKTAGFKAVRNEDLTPLTDEQCLLATPWVHGFDLKAKDWGLFHVEAAKDIVWNDDAFTHLVLPGDEKELAWSFVESKNFANSSFDDFVADKGRGIIILMFGPPGVGKTYTAEAVAEKGRVPLYSISAGALGANPHEVEAALDHALELCRLWNAMLLLDEADVFLGARKEGTLARNELVSIFLTKLEYYQGILFLTTNRIASIDHAFQSRVDLLLPYYDLAVPARRQVWENFVKRAGGGERFEIVGEDYDRLALLKLNGREIKSLIKSTLLLSLKSGNRVTIDRLYQLAEKRVKALEMLNIEVEID